MLVMVVAMTLILEAAIVVVMVVVVVVVIPESGGRTTVDMVVRGRMGRTISPVGGLRTKIIETTSDFFFVPFPLAPPPFLFSHSFWGSFVERTVLEDLNACLFAWVSMLIKYCQNAVGCVAFHRQICLVWWTGKRLGVGVLQMGQWMEEWWKKGK